MKNAPKHTPGPWIGEDYFVFASNTLRIADCDCDDQDMPESEIEANTRLIAAAPAMYKALKEFTAFYESMGGHKDNSVIRNGKAALAQADGKG